MRQILILAQYQYCEQWWMYEGTVAISRSIENDIESYGRTLTKEDVELATVILEEKIKKEKRVVEGPILFDLDRVYILPASKVMESNVSIVNEFVNGY